MRIAPEDQKKVRALAVLGVILLGAIYYAFFSGPSTPSYTPPTTPKRTADTITPEEQIARAPSRTQVHNEEFHPVLHPKRKEDQIPADKIDPVIKLYLLAKLQQVPAAGSGRNLFQFGATPPPAAAVKDNGPVIAMKYFVGTKPMPELEPPRPVTKPPEPPPAPFTPKYYGLATSTASGRKRAFFLDGDDYLIKSEGETVKGHFRLVRIGQTSCVVEDTDSKKQQTIQIAEEAQG